MLVVLGREVAIVGVFRFEHGKVLHLYSSSVSNPYPFAKS